jgi:hypothetical protein
LALKPSYNAPKVDAIRSLVGFRFLSLLILVVSYRGAGRSAGNGVPAANFVASGSAHRGALCRASRLLVSVAGGMRSGAKSHEHDSQNDTSH